MRCDEGDDAATAMMDGTLLIPSSKITPGGWLGKAQVRRWMKMDGNYLILYA